MVNLNYPKHKHLFSNKTVLFLEPKFLYKLLFGEINLNPNSLFLKSLKDWLFSRSVLNFSLGLIETIYIILSSKCVVRRNLFYRGKHVLLSLMMIGCMGEEEGGGGGLQ